MIPTRIYSSSEFIASLPLLEAITADSKADERDKGGNGHDNDNDIKHGVPPHLNFVWFLYLQALSV